MDFIASTVEESEPGAEAELAVWERLKAAFDNDDYGVAYHKYPIIDKGGNRFDHEPDIVLLHREYGLVVIEVKGYQIDQIDRIEGHTWYLDGISQRTAKPHAQARSQANFLRSFFVREQELMGERGCKIPVNQLVALPNITRDDWDEAGFDGPAAPQIITKDELTPAALRTQFENLKTFGSLEREELRAGLDVLSCGQPISGESLPPAENPNSKADHYEKVVKGLNGLDLQQQEIGVQIPPGPQQIRGIAGSGKTVLLAMKAARMHEKHPDWDIVFTFYTKSLYNHLTGLIERFYEHFTDSEPNFDKLHVIHAWGGKQAGDGVYYRLAKQSKTKFRSFGTAQTEFADEDIEPFEGACQRLLDYGDIDEQFDAVLIDEAQDFGPAFFNLCREALHEPERLIWAYDEAQNLSSLTAPSPINIFGTDADGEPKLDLSGQYKRGIRKSHIMRRAYRAPRAILMLAHAFGMGLKRDDGPVQLITRQEGWRNIGYEIEADFRRYGSEATLTREKEQSPHPLQDIDDAEPFVKCRGFPSKQEEAEWVAEHIKTDIQEEGLDPEQILVIPLGPNGRGHAHFSLRNALNEYDIEINCVWNNDDHKQFTKPGNVTVSRINRAKGNEAASVYVMSTEAVENENRRKGPVQRRNEAFVAITRSRSWCTITGQIGDRRAMFNELHSLTSEVSQEEPEITFEVPNPKSLEHELEEDTDEYDDSAITDF
ncbi:NERD domain-containing protein [Halobacterium salinarum]|uniref:DEAD/DEAH box helicase n=1 Tax=Halobacterium salinarum TaxID=2242 RepID=UPI002554E47C|nr:nuclease-related domain-containing DEAD/DEAH box helicase [Halobacterium salinarum]MDL0126420.1 NERD domain-containing protein [Halobacterium salinarum]